MTQEKELVGASTALLILGVLAKSPDYGYQIVKRINQEAETIFQWQEGTVYPLLHKLEEEGWIRSQWETAENGRKRKYYYITSEGKETLESKVKQWKEFSGVINRIMEVSSHAG